MSDKLTPIVITFACAQVNAANSRNAQIMAADRFIVFPPVVSFTSSSLVVSPSAGSLSFLPGLKHTFLQPKDLSQPGFPFCFPGQMRIYPEALGSPSFRIRSKARAGAYPAGPLPGPKNHDLPHRIPLSRTRLPQAVQRKADTDLHSWDRPHTSVPENSVGQASIEQATLLAKMIAKEGA